MQRAFHVLGLAAIAVVLAGAGFAATRSRTSDSAITPLSAVGAPTPMASPRAAPPPRTATPARALDFAIAVDELAHAPAGRTGIASVDAMIDALTSGEARVIETLGAVPWQGTDECTTVTPRGLDATVMATAFAATQPPLHSVFTAASADVAAHRDEYAIVLGHSRRSGVGPEGERAWKIAVERDRITSVETFCGYADIVFEPPLTEIERYLLLPPEEDLPPPIALHAAPPATGRAALDAIVEEALNGNGAALADRVRATEYPCTTARTPAHSAPPCGAGTPDGAAVPAVAVNECGRLRFEDLDTVRRGLVTLIAGAQPSLHAIAELPSGYVPSGDALVLLSWELRRYNWASAGLVVDGEAITGLLLACGTGRPEWLYPPTIIVGPFPGAVAGTGPTWSGMSVIDQVIVALSNGDRQRIRELVDPVLIGCVAEPLGIGSPPLCREGEPPGTLVPVLPVTDCEVAYLRPEDLDGLVDTLAGMAPRLYAVTAPPRGYADLWQLAQYTLLVFDSAAEPPTAAFPTIAVSEIGIAGFASGCDSSLTVNLLRPSPAPTFLVAPAR